MSHSRQSSHHMTAPNVLPTADPGHGTSQMLRTEISRFCLLWYLVLLIYQLKGCYVIQLINYVIAHSDRWEEQQWIQPSMQKCSNRNVDDYGLFRLKRRKNPEERCEQWSQSWSRIITTIKLFICERVSGQKYEMYGRDSVRTPRSVQEMIKRTMEWILLRTDNCSAGQEFPALTETDWSLLNDGGESPDPLPRGSWIRARRLRPVTLRSTWEYLPFTSLSQEGLLTITAYESLISHIRSMQISSSLIQSSEFRKQPFICFTKTRSVYKPVYVFVICHVPCRCKWRCSIQHKYCKFYMRGEDAYTSILPLLHAFGVSLKASFSSRPKCWPRITTHNSCRIL